MGIAGPRPPPPDAWLRRFWRFGLVGAVGTPAHYLTLILLVEAAGAGPVVSTIAGSVVGGAVNYLLNRRYTFGNGKPHRAAAPRFVVVAVGTGVLNAALVYLGTGLAEMHYLAVQVVATLIVLAINFGLNSAWTFKEGNTA